MRKQFSQSSDKGFTIFELLVASVIGLVILSLAAGSVLSLRRVYSHDIIRTRLNQDIRGSLDMLGINIRQAGESFNVSFPAIQIIDGASGAPDELVLRRNLLDEVLNICTDIAAGSVTTDIYFATTGTDPGCARGSNLQNFSAWQNYRLAAPGQQVEAYAFNPGTRLGEFFVYNGELDDTAQLKITRTAGAWQYDHNIGSGAAYIMEEWRFRMQGDVLQLIVNGDTVNALNVAFSLTDFQVRGRMADDSMVDALGVNDDWTNLKSIEVSLSAEAQFAGQTIGTSLTSEFFPRNVLSN